MAGGAVKRARAGGGSIGDRLSALPDELLLHVLSFLPAQQVVRTTVLSKRWMDLWRSVPGINLSFSDFRRDLTVDWRAALERSVDFVNNMLMLHRAPCVDAFRLAAFVDRHNCCRHFDTWLRRAIKDDPLVLECVDVDQLVDVFAIRTPRLASVSVDLRIPFSLDGGNSLVRASISCEPGKFSPQRGAMLLGSLVNVTSLEWERFQAMAALDGVFDNVPIFQNLRTLSLEAYSNIGTSDVCELKAVGKFIQKSPSLEKLTLKHFKVMPAVEHVDFPILENLRTLCLHFCDLHDNLQILLHCLRNSPNLEKLNITDCNLSNDSMGGKGKAKSKKTYSQSINPGFRCLKLEYAEIIHCYGDAGVHELVSYLLDVAAPTITIKVTKSEDCLLACPLAGLLVILCQRIAYKLASCKTPIRQ